MQMVGKIRTSQFTFCVDLLFKLEVELTVLITCCNSNPEKDALEP